MLTVVLISGEYVFIIPQQIIQLKPCVMYKLYPNELDF